MIRLEDIRNKITQADINIFEVSLPVSKISEDGINFDTIEDFLNFVFQQNIQVLFAEELVKDKANFYITEETVNDVCGRYVQREVIDIITGDIDKYNESIDKISFDAPNAVIVSCLYQGQYCYSITFNETSAEYNKLLEPTEVLKNILAVNEEKIERQKEERKRTIENLKLELKEKIINDKDFKNCTNQHLRYVYMENLLRKKLDNRYNLLKQQWVCADVGIYRGASDFIELLWREIR